jgi:hypothetical protein
MAGSSKWTNEFGRRAVGRDPDPVDREIDGMRRAKDESGDAFPIHRPAAAEGQPALRSIENLPLKERKGNG